MYSTFHDTLYLQQKNENYHYQYHIIQVPSSPQKISFSFLVAVVLPERNGNAVEPADTPAVRQVRYLRLHLSRPQTRQQTPQQPPLSRELDEHLAVFLGSAEGALLRDPQRERGQPQARAARVDDARLRRVNHLPRVRGLEQACKDSPQDAPNELLREKQIVKKSTYESRF